MAEVTILEPIILLNASYELLNENLSMQKAARFLAKGKAVIEEAHESGRKFGQWVYPKVLRLVKYVKVNYAKIYGPPKPSRRAIFAREDGICAYKGCNNKANTIDHINPKSRGGRWDWLNLVACCQPCNFKKANRTPEEANMVLKFKPFVPSKKDLSFV